MKSRLLGVTSFLGIFFGIALQSTLVHAGEQVKDEVNARSSPTLIIDNITCQGNTNTECSFVTKKYYQQIGDVLIPDEISDARLRLGTLIQFKSVNIHLEKGHQRGHVVVVFDINEASNIQYDLGLSYAFNENSFSWDNYCKQTQGDLIGRLSKCGLITNETSKSHFGLNGKVSNFNFLGTGKELSFSFSGARYLASSELSVSDDAFGDSAERIRNNGVGNFNNNNYSLGLRYYDPYLLNSSNYYLSTGIRYHKDRIQVTHLDNGDQQHNRAVQPSSDSLDNPEYTIMDVSLGRRFGSHSYFSIDIISVFYQFDEYTPLMRGDDNLVEVTTDDKQDMSYALTYGWNSEDDALFPTQGSDFSTTFSKNDSLFDYNIYTSYKQNFALTDNQVLAFGGNVSVNRYDRCSGCFGVNQNSGSASVFTRYSQINPIDKSNGSYAGWYIGLHLGQSNEIFSEKKSTFTGFNAGYTYQTDSMIYRFSLALNKQERK
jgi:outer membrane protein assembly factor BamA